MLFFLQTVVHVLFMILPNDPVVILSKKLYPHCLVDSKNGVEHDLAIEL